MAPTTRSGSAPVATASGSGVSGDSCEMSCSHAKNLRKRAALMADLVADRAAQHRIGGLERVEDRAGRVSMSGTPPRWDARAGNCSDRPACGDKGALPAVASDSYGPRYRAHDPVHDPAGVPLHGTPRGIRPALARTVTRWTP